MGKSNNSKKKKFYQSGSRNKDQGSKDFMQSGNPEGGFNDIAWWSANPALLKDSATLSYGNIAGLDVDYNVSSPNAPVNKEAIPGIMAFNFIPILGISRDGNSPVNNASRLLYSYVRHANSGSRNYEQSDLFTYVLAVSNLLIMHAELTRLYGLAQVYHKTNRYIGKAIIQTLGYDFDDVINNLASLRYGLNALAVRINSFAIPSQIHIFARHISLVSNVFKDSSESKGQVYLFRPSQLFKWSAIDPDGNPGSSLKPVMLPTYNSTGTVLVAEALAFLSDMIDILATNEDCGLMSGDLLKAFGDSGLYHVNAIPETYIVEPVYDQVMLSQIHNMDITPVRPAGLPNVQDLWVRQNDNNILYAPKLMDIEAFTELNMSTPFSKILDSGMEVPTPEFNMEATRLKTAINYSAENDGWIIEATGTEIITSASIYTLQAGVVKLVGTINPFEYLNPDVPSLGLLTLLTGILNKNLFDWAPIQMIFTNRSGSIEVYPCGELFNYTLIDNQYLHKVHNAALLSALNVYSLAAAKVNK